MPASALLIFLICSLVMVGAGMLVSHMLAPKSKNIQKEEPYECGVPTQGSAWIQFRVGYYLFAIIFLIFDVETVFIVPWAVAFTEMGLAAFIEILIFLGVLGLGLIYAWKKGALKWE
ncbi:MAG: NADH-quinone oxidoreductase subunit A [Cyclobacteriaceae bacterium]|nr:MAG: NADH-quinone oxidoreductase subunit A [Cyclobacteriaceae bacterium]